jgi:hypothetical protein
VSPPPEQYAGTGSYGVLTDAEQATWNEYCTLRQISDWSGYDAAQDARRAAARAWLLERMEYLEALAAGEVLGEPAGWDTNNRGERYDYLGGLNSGAPKHEVRLPCPGSATDTERVYIEEREGYLAFGSAYEAQKTRKLENLNWLQTRRKKVWHLMRDDPDGNEVNDRQARYDALCIATSHGEAYAQWAATHNKWGDPYTEDAERTTGSGRSACKAWLDEHLGVSENPPESNRGSPQPSGWQERVYGDDGVPWCACFAVCSAWDNGVAGSGTASVYQNAELAKRGDGIYRGWTSDPAQVHAGDHAFCGDDHTGVIYDRDSAVTVEGNTSPGSEGSQYNGGCVAKRSRGWGYWTAGFGLVRFPD